MDYPKRQITVFRFSLSVIKQKNDNDFFLPSSVILTMAATELKSHVRSKGIKGRREKRAVEMCGSGISKKGCQRSKSSSHVKNISSQCPPCSTTSSTQTFLAPLTNSFELFAIGSHNRNKKVGSTTRKKKILFFNKPHCYCFIFIAAFLYSAYIYKRDTDNTVYNFIFVRFSDNLTTQRNIFRN